MEKLNFGGNNNNWPSPPMTASLQSPSSSTTGIIPSNHDIKGVDLYMQQDMTMKYSNTQTVALVRNIVKEKLFRKMKFVHDKQLYFSPMRKGTLCFKITNECFLNQGRTEDQEDWWRMICVELKKAYTQIRGTTMTTVKLSFMSK